MYSYECEYFGFVIRHMSIVLGIGIDHHEEDANRVT